MRRRSLFFLMDRLPPSSLLFPYTTLFRSRRLHRQRAPEDRRERRDVPRPRRPRRGQEGPARAVRGAVHAGGARPAPDRKSTRLNSSHVEISYAVFCLKKKKQPYLYACFPC